MTTQLYQVNAFTDQPFHGNPAAVCLLRGPRDEEWMQQVAGEMNLSETAFLQRREDGFGLRWFTPTAEVDLCGHATLASAHILWQCEAVAADAVIRFATRSGVLTARRDGEWIELNFPSTPPEECDAPAELLSALDVEPLYTGRSKFDYLIEIESEERLRELRPNFQALREIPVRGVIVTARGSEAGSKPGSEAGSKGYDFVSRFFASASGIDEDPVTGSAHCCLGPYWQRRLGKDEFLAYQASARGGEVRVEVAGERIRLGGKAVTVMRCELAV